MDAAGAGSRKFELYLVGVRSTRRCGRGVALHFGLSGKRKGPRVGRPRLKSRKGTRQSFRLTRREFRIRSTGRLHLAKIGDVRLRWSRALPSDPSSVTIIREPDGQYYASFVVQVPPTPLPDIEREAGIDLFLPVEHRSRPMPAL